MDYQKEVDLQTKGIGDKEAPPAKKHEKTNPRVLYMVLAFVGLLGVLLIVYLADFSLLVGEKEVEESSEEDSQRIISETGLEGEIYLTLSPYTYEDMDEGFFVKPNLYLFDLATQKLAPVPFVEDSYYHNYMASFSPDLSKMVFVKSYREDKNKVMIWNESQEHLRALTLFLDFLPRNPKFSPDGREVTYWGSNDLTNPEGSSVYISSLDGEQEEITNGAYPIFSPRGNSLIFLKNDGLYTIDLKTREESLAVDLKDEVLFPDLDLTGLGWYSFRFNVSPDGRFLVITNTLGRSNRILEITSWRTFEYELYLEPDFSQPIWPVFSPNGNYLALEEYRFDEDFETLRLSIYDLETFEIVGGTSLDDYELDYVWVTDWIIR